ncbi:hypothetical protein [Pseudomonas moraviensis]|uniref:Uncharacterized protein n=1 Tax=Pseudomonas moraviensis TaxID=321662 RepID=A0A7Z0ATB3_9PSED|nr:hypothetical protein [Pseudomonas moraviensis]NYH08240.1 hypothetical protein [Pseudomonas moraviensis]
MTPGAIFTSLKKELGAINPYMAIVDSAVKVFLEMSEQSTNPPGFISAKAKTLGYGTLYLEKLELERSKQFVYLSHIAFINGKAETACDNIKKQSLVAKPTVNVDGDFLRRTIRVIHSSRVGMGVVVNDDVALPDFVDASDVAVIDYFRKMRNINFHGGNSEAAEIFSNMHASAVKGRYGWLPSPVGSLTSQDMILLSKVWQRVIRDLCEKSLDAERDVLPLVAKRYRGVTSERMANGAMKFLQQEYLLDTNAANELISKI